MSFGDWTRNGKRDHGDRYIEYLIMQEMNKEEQQDNVSNYNAGGGCLGVGIFNILVFAFIGWMIQALMQF